MSLFLRVWLLLAVSFAAAKFAIDLTLGGTLSDSAASWIAVAPIAAIQAALIVALLRFRNRAAGDAS